MKRFLLKHLDTNNNQKLEFSEWFPPLLFVFIVELSVGILANYFYDLILKK